MRQLDPETDGKLWALAERISELPTGHQVMATIVAISALLSEQDTGTLDRIFASVKQLVAEFQTSPEFKARTRGPKLSPRTS